MEEVSGIPTSLPSLAPYPTREIQSSLPPEEWQACLDTWIFCLEFRLRLSAAHFSVFKLSQFAGGLPFLLTYFQNFDNGTNSRHRVHGSEQREAKLRHLCFLLLRRLLLATRTTFDCSPARLFEVLSHASIVYANSFGWRDALKQLLKRSSTEVLAAVDTCKGSLVQNIMGTSPLDLQHAIAITRVLPECGLLFMTGSDYLEALINGHGNLHRLSTEHAFLCLRSLMSDESPKQSLLLDHLYLLKSFADKSMSANPNQSTLLSSLVVATPFLTHLVSHLSGLQGSRGQKLLESLQAYREQTLHLHPPPLKSKPKARKGKGRATADDDEMHMHKAGQVSQIHELFPDLSDRYILQLLDHFADNVEAATAALLEPDSLPSDLKEPSVPYETHSFTETRIRTVPQSVSTHLPQRKNVFDGDDFDNLRVSTGKLHIGRKDKLNNAPQRLDEHARSKAAILSALAAFDADDDERDDSYDVADVGGNVDDTVDTDSRQTNEELLYRAWRDELALFARDSKTRLSQPRQKLKQETGMTDEQIEGWALMLSRDDNMQNRLKQRYYASATFKGNQNSILGTRWQAGQSDSDDNGSDGQGARRFGTAGTRGGRPFRGRGGGSTGGPADAPSTQAARKRKDQGRGRGGANHNRREGFAKKVNRGMAGPIQ